MTRQEYASMQLFYEDKKHFNNSLLTEAFLRPVYQYTHQEIRNTQREHMMASGEFYKDGEINY